MEEDLEAGQGGENPVLGGLGHGDLCVEAMKQVGTGREMVQVPGLGSEDIACLRLA